MIEIRTNTGESLDLAPDVEFEVEMNNPLLETDRIPVAFSTAITFPPSDTNRSVFGYLPAMLLPPSVTKAGCTILSEGIPILIGNLVYDSLDEDGNLVYTFTEKALDDGLDKKIFELDLPASQQPGGWSPDQLAQRIRNGLEEGIGAPVLFDPAGEVTKFHNLPFSNNKSRFTPCVSFQRLFEDISFSFLGSCQEVWNGLYILGLYKPFTGNMSGYGDTLSIAQSLPDVTLLNLVKEFCKMTCSAVFVAGRHYVFVPFSYIVQALTLFPIDWNDKISDIHSFALEKATGYAFGYQKEDNGNSGETTEEIMVVSSLLSVLNAYRPGQYTPVMHTGTDDTYSAPPSAHLIVNEDYYYGTEILNFHDESRDTEIEGEKMDNHLSSSLIRNVPINFWRTEWEEDDSYPGGSHPVDTESYFRMSGLVSFPADGGERDSKVILGNFGHDQFVGKGLGMSDDGNDFQIGSSLTAAVLYAEYHTEFEAWLAKDRQIISMDIDLSMQDINSFRMWQVVTVRNRLFLVKRLTLRLSTKMDRVLSSVELINL
jgi:hypothetical protein